MKLQEAQRNLIEELLSIYPKREAEEIAHWVLEKITGLSATQRLLEKDQVLSEGEERQLSSIESKLLAQIPIQYVLHEAWFYKRPYYVDSNVLIPRPETEELVEWILKDFPSTSKNKFHVLDVGTGSGCIPISLKKERNQWQVWAIDRFVGALKVAKENANMLEAEVIFKAADLFDHSWYDEGLGWDIIVSNPPYVTESERMTMEKRVKDQEPETALFVPDDQPLLFYKGLLQLAEKKLKPDGRLYVEINESYGQEVIELFETCFKEVALKKDASGKDRMIRATHLHN